MKNHLKVIIETVTLRTKLYTPTGQILPSFQSVLTLAVYQMPCIIRYSCIKRNRVKTYWHPVTIAEVSGTWHAKKIIFT